MSRRSAPAPVCQTRNRSREGDAPTEITSCLSGVRVASKRRPNTAMANRRSEGPEIGRPSFGFELLPAPMLVGHSKTMLRVPGRHGRARQDWPGRLTAPNQGRKHCWPEPDDRADPFVTRKNARSPSGRLPLHGLGRDIPCPVQHRGTSSMHGSGASGRSAANHQTPRSPTWAPFEVLPSMRARKARS